jgi:hypothetical protein
MPHRPRRATASLQLICSLVLALGASACYVDLGNGDDDDSSRDDWIDTDGDGIPDAPPPPDGQDSDGDTISDLEEGSADPDGDGPTA